MKKIDAIKILDGHRVWLRFDDQVEGVVDLAVDFDQGGVFGVWRDDLVFRQAAISNGGRALEWPGEVDLCADALYLRVTGKTPEELFPHLKAQVVYA